MLGKISKNGLLVIVFFVILFITANASAQLKEQGIYITQLTAESTSHIKYLIRESKAVGINVFVVDFERKTPAYVRNIQLIESNGIKYIVRIVVFPEGGYAEQVLSKEYWQKKYSLIEQAIALGAKEVQLDYIRYKSSQPSSAKNAKDIYQVIKYFKNQLKKHGIPLQIDVFGISVFSSAVHIGQNLQLFADSLDGICPMLYPSHFEPYEQYSKAPYETIRSAINALRSQFNGNIPIKVYPYIELSNYHYKFSTEQKINYIYEQLRAVKDSNVAGWYAWSPSNRYDNLFLTLKMFSLK